MKMGTRTRSKLEQQLSDALELGGYFAVKAAEGDKQAPGAASYWFRIASNLTKALS